MSGSFIKDMMLFSELQELNGNEAKDFYFKLIEQVNSDNKKSFGALLFDYVMKRNNLFTYDESSCAINILAKYSVERALSRELSIVINNLISKDGENHGYIYDYIYFLLRSLEVENIALHSYYNLAFELLINVDFRLELMPKETHIKIETFQIKFFAPKKDMTEFKELVFAAIDNFSFRDINYDSYSILLDYYSDYYIDAKEREDFKKNFISRDPIRRIENDSTYAFEQNYFSRSHIIDNHFELPYKMLSNIIASQVDIERFSEFRKGALEQLYINGNPTKECKEVPDLVYKYTTLDSALKIFANNNFLWSSAKRFREIGNDNIDSMATPLPIINNEEVFHILSRVYDSPHYNEYMLRDINYTHSLLDDFYKKLNDEGIDEISDEDEAVFERKYRRVFIYLSTQVARRLVEALHSLPDGQKNGDYLAYSVMTIDDIFKDSKYKTISQVMWDIFSEATQEPYLNYIKKVKILSTSINKNEGSMWTNYAEQNKGAVIEISHEKLIDDKEIQYGHVNYREIDLTNKSFYFTVNSYIASLPFLTFTPMYSHMLADIPLNLLPREAILTKLKSSWQYEAEYRFFRADSDESDSKYYSNNDSVKSITFGEGLTVNKIIQKLFDLKKESPDYFHLFVQKISKHDGDGLFFLKKGINAIDITQNIRKVLLNNKKT